MIYRPPRQRGFAVGAGLTLWALLLASLLLTRAATWPVSLPSFLAYAGGAALLALAALFAYWTYACLWLHYVIDRDAFTMHWGGLRRVVPLAHIQRLVPGYSLPPPRIRGLNWWGHHVGQGQVDPIGQTLFYSTHHSLEELLYIITDDGNYGVSAHNIGWLIREVQLRQSLGPLREVTAAASGGSLWGHPFWHDRHAQVMALTALALNIGLFAFLFSVYPGLPEKLSLAFPQPLDGERLGPKGDVLQIPLVGLAVLGINVVLASLMHWREQALARLLYAATIATQMMLWVAAGIAVG